MRNKPKRQNVNDVIPKKQKNKFIMDMIYWFVGIIASLVVIWQFFFPNMFKSKSKETNPIELNSKAKLDSSTMNNIQNKKTSIGRDQNNAGRDVNTKNSEKK